MPNRLSRPRGIRFKILVRRVHLYAGLFLLPWVFLYGVTGAMFNHQGLFPEVTTQTLDASHLTGLPMSNFPAPQELAEQVVAAIQASASDSTIEIADDSGAEFTGNLMFEVHHEGRRHVVRMDPLSKISSVVTQPKKRDELTPVLTDIHNLQLDPNPHHAAKESAKHLFHAVGVESNAHPRPVGWTKLNFLALVNGEPVRVTYVINDGHVDISKYTGSNEMSLRQFLLRLHTSHGQSPHWNGRWYWSLFVDAMAIALVSWGLTGLFMWWQLKRARLYGSIVIATSLLTATWIYFSMVHFYATTKL